ncbi:MAG: FHA domain-containing protein [Myxococcales bacterium]|nr:FHA domain-containing protein [Myxococcales bacterium]MCB9521099.1 FHA domain-containing protein [Myxococcales bacterium]
MAKLVYTEGGTQHEFVLEAGRSAFTIGRNPMCDLRINNPSISRKHAEIRVDAGGAYSIFDLNSSNGTYVNGRREQQADLKDGDELLIGEFEVLFVGAAPKQVLGARRGPPPAPLGPAKPSGGFNTVAGVPAIGTRLNDIGVSGGHDLDSAAAVGMTIKTDAKEVLAAVAAAQAGAPKALSSPNIEPPSLPPQPPRGGGPPPFGGEGGRVASPIAEPLPPPDVRLRPETPEFPEESVRGGSPSSDAVAPLRAPDEASRELKAARAELKSLRLALQNESGRAAEAVQERAKLQRELKQRDEELTELHARLAADAAATPEVDPQAVEEAKALEDALAVATAERDAAVQRADELSAAAADAARVGDLEQRLQQLEAELAQARADAEKATAEVGRTSTDASRNKSELDRLRGEASRAKSDAERARTELQKAQEEAAKAKAAIDSAKAEAETAKADAESAKADAAKAAAEAEGARADAAKAKAEADEARSTATTEVERARSDASRVGADASAAAAELGAAKAEAAQARAELASARDAVASAEAAAAEANEAAKTVRAELAEVSGRLEKQKSAGAGDAERARAEAAAAAEEVAKYKAELRRRIAELDALRRDTEKKDARIAELDAKAAAMKDAFRDLSAELQGLIDANDALSSELASLRGE